MNWGIPLPFDPDFVTYVWFDALVNYITIPAAHGDDTWRSGRPFRAQSSDTRLLKLQLWPADIHVIGKDIVKFHAVYWPIMLKAMGLPLPKQILVHGWWQKDGAKISKSTGNIVDPIAVIDEWGLDAFRFYVLRELDIGPDGNWTDAGFRARYQAELANGLGNLVNRSLSMLKRYRNGVVPAKHRMNLPPTPQKVVGRNARVAEAKPTSGRAAKHLVARHARQPIRGPDRAVQAGERPGAGEAARRSALQSGRNLPRAGGFALAVPARHGDEDLRAAWFERRAGQFSEADLGRT